jgi:outer membrane receptor protein involved in Fe transport
LQQVVANSWESGFRGHLDRLLEGYVDWNAGFFHIINNDDIIFQANRTGANSRGYFDNVGKTLRQGVEVGLSGLFFDRWHWSANYTFIDATYQTRFSSLSPAHPLATEALLMCALVAKYQAFLHIS